MNADNSTNVRREDTPRGPRIVIPQHGEEWWLSESEATRLRDEITAALGGCDRATITDGQALAIARGSLDGTMDLGAGIREDIARWVIARVGRAEIAAATIETGNEAFRIAREEWRKRIDDLGAEVARMLPVIQAAEQWRESMVERGNHCTDDALIAAVDQYRKERAP